MGYIDGIHVTIYIYIEAPWILWVIVIVIITFTPRSERRGQLNRTSGDGVRFSAQPYKIQQSKMVKPNNGYYMVNILLMMMVILW